MVVPLAIAVPMLLLMVMLVPAVMAVMNELAGTLVPVTGIPTTKPVVLVIGMTAWPALAAPVEAKATVRGMVKPAATSREAPRLLATVVPEPPEPRAKALVRRTTPWLTLKAWPKVLREASTSVPVSPLATACVVFESMLPVSVSVLPGSTRISLPALRVRKLRPEEKVSVARKWPPWRLMTLPAAPRAPSLAAASTPPLMLTVPSKSLAALASSIVPAPFLMRPKPNCWLETLPEKMRPNGWTTVDAVATLSIGYGPRLDGPVTSRP